MLKYVRYLLMFPLLIVALAGIAAGGSWMWSGLMVSLIVVVGGDAMLSDDPVLPAYSMPELLNGVLFSTLPFIAALFVLLVWMTAPSGDPLGLAHAVRGAAGWDLLAARSRTETGDLAGGVLSVVLLTGIAGINMAHELMHRSSPVMRAMGRLLQVFSFDVPGHIAHLNGHHVLVGTRNDPSTARRGESSWIFLVRAIFTGNVFSWQTERDRLGAQGHAAFSWRNRFLQGHASSMGATAIAWWMSGWRGALTFVVTAVLSKALLELVNYIQHYGLVRVEGTPIEIRHSWNSNKRMSTYLLCNVTRHSWHHVEPALPFWAIRPMPEAPTLRHGYLTSILIALVPWVWHRHMARPLADWDAHHASQAESRLASGDPWQAAGQPALAGDEAGGDHLPR
ncbi:MAG TPA: alkane 1-monooxygenase [Trinickia sp.]|nr:alkane 1-monooxygenase [Trinickia sp.]